MTSAYHASANSSPAAMMTSAGPSTGSSAHRTIRWSTQMARRLPSRSGPRGCAPSPQSQPSLQRRGTRRHARHYGAAGATGGSPPPPHRPARGRAHRTQAHCPRPPPHPPVPHPERLFVLYITGVRLTRISSSVWPLLPSRCLTYLGRPVPPPLPWGIAPPPWSRVPPRSGSGSTCSGSAGPVPRPLGTRGSGLPHSRAAPVTSRVFGAAVSPDPRPTAPLAPTFAPPLNCPTSRPE